MKRELYKQAGDAVIINEELKLEAYLRTYQTDRFAVIGFSGRRNKPDFQEGFRTFEGAENRIVEFFKNVQANVDRKNKYKADKKEKIIQLKKDIKEGTILRTVISYSMTLNSFYQVLSFNKAKTKLQVVKVEKEWTNGDIGYTGNVKATEIPYGDPFEVKITAAGIKIDRQYGYLCNLTDEFYQNHMD